MGLGSLKTLRFSDRPELVIVSRLRSAASRTEVVEGSRRSLGGRGGGGGVRDDCGLEISATGPRAVAPRPISGCWSCPSEGSGRSRGANGVWRRNCSCEIGEGRGGDESRRGIGLRLMACAAEESSQSQSVSGCRGWALR